MIDNTTTLINGSITTLTNNNKKVSNLDNSEHQPSTLSEFYSLSTNVNFNTIDSSNENNITTTTEILTDNGFTNSIENSDTDMSLSYSENNYQNSNKKYSLVDKKNLVSRIDKIKNKKIYLKIFKIIHADNYKYTINSNGVFFNVTNLPDNILFKIDHLLDKYEKVLFEKSKKTNLFSNSNNVVINFN